MRITVAVAFAWLLGSAAILSPEALEPSDPVASAPPLIYLAEAPEDGATIRDEIVRIRAVALSHLLPITDLQVWLNGVLIAGQPAGRSRGASRQREVEVEVTLKKKGENIISVVAAHEKARSEEARRTILFEPQREKPDLYLLAIGVQNYASEPLSYAMADARALAELVRAQQGRLFSNVHVEILPEAGPATKDVIRKALDRLEDSGDKARDVKILFLAGHGGMEEDKFYFFVEDHDFAAEDFDDDLPWDAILDPLSDVRRSILLMDTCDSADSRVNFEQMIDALGERYRDLVVLAASDRESQELDTLQHGAFTEALLRGLRGEAEGFLGAQKDGKIDTKELAAWVEREVLELTDNRQNPRSNAGDRDAVDLSIPADSPPNPAGGNDR